jgi:hypothetical protein
MIFVVTVEAGGGQNPERNVIFVERRDVVIDGSTGGRCQDSDIQGMSSVYT